MNPEPKPISTRLDEVMAAARLDGRGTRPAPTLPTLPDVDDDVAEHLEHLHHQRWRSIIPSHFHAAHLDHADGQVLGDVMDWSRLPIDGRPNLLLVGPVGTGKTWAACAAVRPAVEAGAFVVFGTVVDLLDEMRREFDAAPGGPTTIDALTTCRLLVLDELGAERSTDWSAERLHAVVDRRWRTNRPIVATTNLEPRDLRDAIGERTYSRLVGGALAVRLSGEDRRRAR